jgi:hypothetical protein
MTLKRKKEIYPSALEDAQAAELFITTPQTRSPSYRLAYRDTDFLLRDELRPVRLQLELLKPELVMKEHNIENTIIIFGSTRISDPEVAEKQLADAEAMALKDPTDEALARKATIIRSIAVNSKYYEEARRLSYLISQAGKSDDLNFVVITGGGPGIMEAANRGAFDAGLISNDDQFAMHADTKTTMEEAIKPLETKSCCSDSVWIQEVAFEFPKLNGDVTSWTARATSFL